VHSSCLALVSATPSSRPAATSHQPDAAIGAIGVPASAASCDPVTTDKAGGNGNHVRPGTSTSATVRVNYPTAAPWNGSHFAPPALGHDFYTAEDRPPIETLVHNLEHGYPILWYDQQAGDAKRADLRQLADVASNTDWALGSSSCRPGTRPTSSCRPARSSPSRTGRPPSTPETSVASQAGHRQMCGNLSGQVVKAFIQRFPHTSGPEPPDG
jgi:hypothetical protein